MLKLIKKLLYLILFVFIAGCIFILVCAFNPALTQNVAQWLQDKKGGNTTDITDNTTHSGQYVSVPGVNLNWLSNNGEEYEVPAKKPGNPPVAVADKNGYEPVKEDAYQILQEEAENITGVIAPGETGDGLIFDEKFYPYYAMLEQDMRQIYSQIYANAQALTVTFTPVINVSVEQLKNVFEAVYNDHPELFWLETEYSCKYLKSGSCVEITLQYNNTANYLEEAKARFKAASANIIAGVETIDGTYQKERYVHDVLLKLVEYDESAAMGQSAYSALVSGKSVCAGYARAFQYLMQQLGIPCYYCTGYTGENHAWNIVDIDGTYYNADVTWADSDPANYDYFNKRDSEIAKTHMRTSLSVYLPACVAKSNVNEPSSNVADWINPNPIEPLRWPSEPDVDNSEGMTAEEKEQENLDKAGIKKEDVRDTMDEYYADCKELLKKAGVGDKKFSNVIPEYLWSSVEKAYTSGDHMKGYASEVLKEFGVEHFVIQLQVQRLGGGYYRVYHNVLTY